MESSRPRRAMTAAALVAACLLLGRVSAVAETRTWTDNLNRAWQRNFSAWRGPSAVFLVDGKEYPFPLARLSVADKMLIFRLRRPPATTISDAV